MNTCPEVLRPVNGVCKNENYPVMFDTMEGNKCCTKLRKYVNNSGSNKFLKLDPKLYISSRIDFKCPDPFCNTYGKGNHRRQCYYDDSNSRYNYGITEFNAEVFNRSIPMNESACIKLQEELPSQQWLDSQKNYVEALDENDKNYLKLYSINGDRALNNFIRNGFKMTDDDIDYIEANMSEFQQTFDKFVEKNGNSYEKYMMDYYYAMDNIIRNSPPLDKRIVLYRGIKDNSYFNGLQNNLYKNNGILSCTGDTKMAIDFSGYAFINRVVIPKGYNCLLNSLSQVLDEFEFILPDNTMFYVSKPFQSKTYLYKIWPEEIQTNEVILVHDKKLSLNGGGTSPEGVCVICTESGVDEDTGLEQVQICSNGHYAHVDCISLWYAKSDKCPECRVDVKNFPLWYEINPSGVLEVPMTVEEPEIPRSDEEFRRLLDENNYDNAFQYFTSNNGRNYVTTRLMEDEANYQVLYDYYVTEEGEDENEAVIQSQPLIEVIMRKGAFNVANALHDFMRENNIEQPNVGPVINLFDEGTTQELAIIDWLYEHGYKVNLIFLRDSVYRNDLTSIRWYFENVIPDKNDERFLELYEIIEQDIEDENMRRVYDVFTQYINQQGGGSMQYGGMWQRGGFFMTCS